MVYANPDFVERICSNDEEDVEISPDALCTASDIQKFYEGANVFITGGTGFIGMAVVEKLLRSCPGIKYVFLLVRSNKGKTAEEKVKEMFHNPLFSKVLASDANILGKVKVVHGDVEQKNIGMSASDAELLKKEVNIVINIAATVRFDEHLKKAYTINVASLKTIVALAESMTNLKAFIHVSTAFAHVHRKSKYMRENFYPCPYTESEMESLLNSADDYTVAVLTDLIKDNMNNTYVLTKGMGEELLHRKINSLPIAVYRPSIVMNSYSEPIRGWSSTLQNAGALMLGIGLGVLRVMNLKPRKRADTIPVDKCASALIALPWHIYSSRQNKASLTPIFNHVPDRNPITWDVILENALRVHLEEKISSKNQVWPVSFTIEPNVFLYNLKFFIYQVLPLPFFVLAERLKNQPPMIRRVYTKIAVMDAQTKPFYSKNWFFLDNNMLNLWTNMSTKDRRLFPLDVGDINWNQYFRCSTKGSLIYLLKETVQSRNSYKFVMFRLTAYILSQVGTAMKIFFAYKASVLGYNCVANFVEDEINRIYL